MLLMSCNMSWYVYVVCLEKLHLYLYYYSSPVCKNLSSKCDKFLPKRSQFDSDHRVDVSMPTSCQSATFVRPLFAFVCPLFSTKNNNK